MTSFVSQVASPACTLIALIALTYRTIPTHNTEALHFDTLIVLGTPCAVDGTASPEQRERVLEGVREWRAGVAPRIIMTGGAAHNRFVEAHCMKVLALAQGVPEDAVVEEGQAGDTIQNIWFSYAIMDQHHWHSAEVVSSPSHLPRTALVLQHYPIAWRTHAARWPDSFTQGHIAALYWGEMKACWILRHGGFKPNRWLPDFTGR